MLDRYGHLFPSVEAAMAEALNASFNADTADNVVPLDRSQDDAA